MALLLSSDFESLPVDPAQRWLKLRDLVEGKLATMFDDREGNSDGDLIEYWSILASAAEELKVGKLTAVSHGNLREDFAVFRSEVIELATRLSLRTSTSNRAFSVAIVRPTRAKIHVQIDRLRKLVSESELDAGRQKKLSRKLDELHALVVAPRTDFAKVMVVLAAIGATVASTTSFLADAPNALGTITMLIGADKEAEDEEQKALEAEPERLRLEDKRSESENDDEIPF